MAKVDVIFLCVVLSPVLFSCVSSSNDDTCIVTNRKNTWKTILGTNFYYSVDNFTNPIKEKYFCTARNSTCKTVKCKECSCKYNDTNFLSYQHGCLSYSHITDVLQARQCMMRISKTHTQQHSIPMINPEKLKNKCHYKLYLRGNDTTRIDNKCSPVNVSFYDMKFGAEVFLKSTKFQLTNNFCLKCKDKMDCDLSELSGHLLKLTMHCARKDKTPMTICFIFALSGEDTEQEGNSHRNNTIQPSFKKGNLQIQRRSFRDSKDNYIHDVFQNLDKQQSFCEEFEADCIESTNCTMCKCKQHETFVSYRYGCMDEGKAEKKLTIDKCLKIQNKDAEEVFTMRQEYLDYGTCLYLQLPTNMTTTARRMSCVVNNTISVNGLTSKEKLLTVHPFKINTNIRDNRICLQCKFFRCDLSQHAGMFLKININCRQNGSTIMDTCIGFAVDGTLLLNETLDEKPSHRNTNSKSYVEVTRSKKGTGETKELFTNPIRNESFCQERQALCETGECLKCLCMEDASTFVSYKHGCSDYQFENCMQSETSLTDFQRKRCLYFSNPPELTKSLNGSCTVKTMSYIEPINGTRLALPLPIPFKISRSKMFKNKLCLQCDLYNCDLSHLSGQILQLGVHCGGIKSTCIALKMAGTLLLNATIPLKISKEINVLGNTRKEELDITVIVVVVVSSCVAIAALVMLLLIKRRTQNKNQKDDRSKSNIELTSPELSDEYASIGACSSIEKIVQLEKTDCSSEENLYYVPVEITYTKDEYRSKEDLAYAEPDELEPVYNILEKEDSLKQLSGHSMNSENIYTDAHASVHEEGKQIFSDGGVGNPIYGAPGDSDKSYGYSHEENSQPQMNKLESGDSVCRCSHQEATTEENEYEVVRKNNKDSDDTEKPLEDPEDEPSSHYQSVGDIIF